MTADPGEWGLLADLLDDLEQQAGSAYASERAAELEDRARAEYQQVTLVGRVMASVGGPLALDVRGVGRVEGDLVRAAAEWCVLAGTQGEWLVRLAAVDRVVGASVRSYPEAAWSPVDRLGVGSALRRLAAAERPCSWWLVDGRQLRGTPRRVGADFVEVAPETDRRRGGAVPPPDLVALSAVAALQVESVD